MGTQAEENLGFRDHPNLWHIGIGLLFATLSSIALFCNFGFIFPFLLILTLCVYLVLLLIVCSKRKESSDHSGQGKWLFELPDKSWAILLVFLLAISNIQAFAKIYIESSSVFYQEDGRNIVLTDKFDAIYFSAVTLTTLGYGDVLPSKAAQKYVIFQLATGMLLLLFSFPVVAGRLSTW